MDAISDMEYDYIASGQYAKVVHPPPGQSVLKLSQDMPDPYFRDESNDEEEMEINAFRIEEAVVAFTVVPHI
ncbi:hypothetical protein DY000_02010342 [Brassica cretica]|uniref:Uncharacterized protein n=1 Tax=Brassica cretica TaxID=69181 RepID=A0ABQ7C0J5_BRACR|nr:hypothetical protein DY000_02010342 [Brassica cretica]